MRCLTPQQLVSAKAAEGRNLLLAVPGHAVDGSLGLSTEVQHAGWAY